MRAGDWRVIGGVKRLYPRPPTHPPTPADTTARGSHRVSCATHARSAQEVKACRAPPPVPWLRFWPGYIKLLREKGERKKKSCA